MMHEDNPAIKALIQANLDKACAGRTIKQFSISLNGEKLNVINAVDEDDALSTAVHFYGLECDVAEIPSFNDMD